jgi:hypothetical protein
MGIYKGEAFCILIHREYMGIYKGEAFYILIHRDIKGYKRV